MPRFEVVGFGKETGRKRVRVYDVADQEAAICAAAADGTVVQTDKIKLLPDPPPSERQINYAKQYGIKTTPNMTGKQLSALLTKAEDQDWPTVDQIKKAKKLKLNIPEKITGDKLDDMIWAREDEIEDRKDELREKAEDAKFDKIYGPIRRRPSRSTAFALSLIIPGAGQMYKGRILKGLIWLVIVPLFYSQEIEAGAFLHIFCVMGAGLRK